MYHIVARSLHQDEKDKTVTTLSIADCTGIFSWLCTHEMHDEKRAMQRRKVARALRCMSVMKKRP